MPCRCACATPATICANSDTSTGTDGSPFASTYPRRFGPSISAIVKYGRPPLSSMS